MWISVKDRLPEKDQIVLIFYDGDCFVGHIQLVYDGGDARFKEASGGLYNIPATHWQPLPKHPKL